MAEPTPVAIVTLSRDELKAIIGEAVREALAAAPLEDKLLDIDQACEMLSCKRDFLYHAAHTLPFTRKLGGHLRFSRNGIQEYIKAKKLREVKK
jgi:excisionase family DNA binding protein